MNTDVEAGKDRIGQAFALARAGKSAYAHLYPFLESFFILIEEAKQAIAPAPIEYSSQMAQTRWAEGFPLLNRWDFPLDFGVAEHILAQSKDLLPEKAGPLAAAHSALSKALIDFPNAREDLWRSFLQHEMEPWEEWIDMDRVDPSSLLFLARSCIRPSIEWTANELAKKPGLPADWFKGYCPICGSLPSLLYLEGEGERKAYCSWCGTQWGLHRLQCPYCDNRLHDSLAYSFVESEPNYRIQYCNLCKYYFKLIDAKELLYPPFFPLEEWTTLHLDLLAQRAGFKQPPSPSPVVYGGESA